MTAHILIALALAYLAATSPIRRHPHKKEQP